MKKLYIFIVLCSVSCFGQNQIQSPAPAGNWGNARYQMGPPKYYLNGGYLIRPTSTQMAFSFTFPTTGTKCVGNQRQTSAAVFNASGVMVRTLWTNRAYYGGATYADFWNGLDDYGHAASGGPFTIKVGCNNVQYSWDGMIGNTENNPNSPTTQDAMVSNFIAYAPVFANGMMYAVTGETEQRWNTPIYDPSNPNGPVTQFLPLLGGAIINQSVSDGHRVYMLVTPYNQSTQGGVIAFGLNGQNWNLAGTAANGGDLATFNLQTLQVLGAAATPATPFTGINFLDRTKLNTGGSPTNTAISGIAVQQDSTGSGSCATDGCLATAHGYYDYEHGTGTTSQTAASLDTVYLWDKLTGTAITSFSITNPQRMVFDLNGNLWVISGYYGGLTSGFAHNILYEVTSVGGSNTVTQIGSSTFQNPTAIAINPVNGHLFIADGGTHQQIFEVNVSTPTTIISTLGVLNGYNNSGSCNANIDPAGHNSPTFWFDPDTSYMPTQFNSPFTAWIQLDQNGDLWIGDFFAGRILHYTENGTSWTYVNRIAQIYANVTTLVTDPTRIFGGPDAQIEYSRNYSVPLLPGDPEAPGGNGSWDIAREWWVCTQTVIPYPSSQFFPHGGQWLSTNGNPITFMSYFHGVGPGFTAFQYARNGTFTYKVGSYPPGGSPDSNGNSYQLTSSGTAPNITYNIGVDAVASVDGNGFPTWGGSYTPIGSYTANASLPQAQNGVSAANGFDTFQPTSDNIIPIFQGTYTAAVGGAPIFHLGGLPKNGSALTWAAAKAVVSPYMNGDGTFPQVNLTGVAQLGTTTATMNTDIFATLAGNNGPWASNFWHYKSDGMVVGQFGWQSGFANVSGINTFGNTGYPLCGLTYPYVACPPGYEGDAATPYWVQVNTSSGYDYYMFFGDQAVRVGIHEYHISNLGSYAELSATGALGTTIVLQ